MLHSSQRRTGSGLDLMRLALSRGSPLGKNSVSGAEFSRSYLSSERNPSMHSEDMDKRSGTEVGSRPDFNGQLTPFGGRAKRKRSFSRNNLDKIAMVRSVGACIRCRISKEACDVGTPCSRCVESSKPQSIDRLPCIRTRLRDFLPRLFAGATTGAISTSRGKTAFQEQLLPFGQRFLYNVRQHPSGHLLELASDSFDSQDSVIKLENVREVLRMLDNMYFHERATASLYDLTEAIFSMCIIMLSTRAFIVSHIPNHEAISGTVAPNRPDLKAAIQSISIALKALFMVASAAMAEDDCYDRISSCAANAFGSRESK